MVLYTTKTGSNGSLHRPHGSLHHDNQPHNHHDFDDYTDLPIVIDPHFNIDLDEHDATSHITSTQIRDMFQLIRHSP